MSENHPTDPADALLRSALRLNAIFSLVSGGFLVIADGLVAALLGTLDAIGWIRAIGIGIFLFGIFVWRTSGERPIPQGAARAIFGLDVAWVVASAVVLTLGWFSDQGWWAVAIVADVVACFAIAEWFGLKRVAGAAAPA